MIALFEMLLIAQAASAPVAHAPPDIEIRAAIRAREVRVEQDGTARIVLRAEPSAEQPEIRVERSAPPGQRRYRNLDLRLDAKARIADPNNPTSQHTGEVP